VVKFLQNTNDISPRKVILFRYRHRSFHKLGFCNYISEAASRASISLSEMELETRRYIYLGVIKHNGRQLWKILIPSIPLIPEPIHSVACSRALSFPEIPRTHETHCSPRRLYEKNVTYICRHCPADKPSSPSTVLEAL